MRVPTTEHLDVPHEVMDKATVLPTFDVIQKDAIGSAGASLRLKAHGGTAARLAAVVK